MILQKKKKNVEVAVGNNLGLGNYGQRIHYILFLGAQRYFDKESFEKGSHRKIIGHFGLSSTVIHHFFQKRQDVLANMQSH